jgi:hypothetical protein
MLHFVKFNLGHNDKKQNNHGASFRTQIAVVWLVVQADRHGRVVVCTTRANECAPGLVAS